MPGPALSPAELRQTHPSLIGAGEWAASGLPAGDNPKTRNNLVSGAAAPAGAAGPIDFNRLTGGATLPVAAVPIAAPVSTVAPPPPPPPPPPGQFHHRAVGKTIGADKLSDADLTTRLARSVYVQNALRALLQSGDVTPASVRRVVAAAVSAGALPQAEADQVAASLPTDPDKLRHALERLHGASLHAAIHLAGEQTRRRGNGKA